MKLVDKEVYIFGYRNTDNDDWNTSGLAYGNKEDAMNEITKMKHYLPKLKYELFKFGRPQPINQEETVVKTNDILGVD